MRGGSRRWKHGARNCPRAPPWWLPGGEDRHRVAGLLEHVGRSVPAGVRLVQLQQDADGLLLGGQAVSVADVSELAAGLETLEQVLPPVEIVDARSGDAGAEAAVRFEIRARLARPVS